MPITVTGELVYPGSAYAGGSPPPPPPPPTVAKIIAAGDFAAQGGGAGTVQALVAQYYADPLTTLMVTVGDNVYEGGSPADWSHFELNSYILRGGTTAANQWVYPTTGHHDWGDSGVSGASMNGATVHSPADGLKPFMDAKAAGLLYGDGLWYYSHDLTAAKWRIIHLSGATNVGAHALGHNGMCVDNTPGSAQYVWFSSQLDQCVAAGLTPLVVFSDPRWATTDDHHSQEPLSQPFWDLMFAKVKNNCLVLNSHKHNYERMDRMNAAGAVDSVNGIPEIVVGTGGVGHYAFTGSPVTGSLVRDAAHFGVLELTLSPSSALVRFVDASSGSALDTVQYTFTGATTGGGSGRFFGDPGAGNIILGFAVQGGTQSLFTALTGPTKLNHNFGCARLYDNGSGLLRPSDIDFHTANGRITHSTVNAGAWVTGSWAAIKNRTDNAPNMYSSWLATIAAQIKARPKVPILLTWLHEPENNIGSQTADDTAKQDYRAAKRVIHQDLRALGCNNYVNVDCCFMGAATFGAASGRDWRFWYADWKGTTTSGDKNSPDPRDFFGGVDQTVDMPGFDAYNFWGNVNQPATTPWISFSSAFTGWNAVSQIHSGPYVIGETGSGEFSGDPRYVNPVWNAANQAQTQNWLLDMYAFALAKNVAVLEWFGSRADNDNLDVNNAPASAGGPWRYPILNQLLNRSTTVQPTVT